MWPFSDKLRRHQWILLVGLLANWLCVCREVFLWSNTSAMWETDTDSLSCTVVSALPRTLKCFRAAGSLVTVWNIHVVPCHLDEIPVSGMVVGRERTVEAVCCQWSQTTCRTVKSLFCSGSSASVASFTLEPWLWAKTVLRWLSDKMTEVQAAARTWINLLPTLPPARRNLLPEVIDRQSLSLVLTLQASQEPACSASGFADYMLTL